MQLHSDISWVSHDNDKYKTSNKKWQKQQYQFIVYPKPFFDNYFSIIWPSIELRHTIDRRKQRSHDNSRAPILSLDVNGSNIKISSALITNPPTKAFLKQYIFSKP